MHSLVDDRLIRLSVLKDALSKGVEGRLRTVARSCVQFDREHRVSFAHGEMGSGASVVEYEAHVFGFALVVVGVVNGRRDAELSVGSIFDERRSWVCVARGVVDDILVCAGYYDWGCRRANVMCKRWR